MPYIEDGLMEIGDWELEIDYNPAVATWDADDWLAVAPEGRPYVHVLVYEGERLAAPPLVLLRRRGDERGFVIGGHGIEWWQGGDVGPLIDYREFISGANRLANGDFAKEFLHWSRREGSLWVAGSGEVHINGNTQADDALVHERTIDVRPGQQWKLEADVSRLGLGAGRLLGRIVYTGRFSHPNLLPAGDFEDPDLWSDADYIAIETGGQRSGNRAMAIGPIPKPRLISNGDFADGATDWTLGTYATIGTDPLTGEPALALLPIPYPSYLLNGGFEHATLGYSWGVSDPNPGNISILADSHAHSGSNVMKVGPITQHEVLTNADFGTGSGTTIPNWYQSSSDSDPHAGIFDIAPTDGNNGTPCAHTVGYSTAGRPGPELIKYLRADKTNGGGVEPYDVEPGESYHVKADFKGAPGTEGEVYVSLHFPHPTVPGHETWMLTESLEAPPHDDLRWFTVRRDFTVPANRPLMNVLAEFHNHGLGHWYLDTLTVIRTSGNRSKSTSLPYPLEANSDYRLSALILSGENHSIGSTRLGVTLSGTGVEDETRDVDQGHTDFQWTRKAIEFTPSEGYEFMTPTVMGIDVLGSMYVDEMALEKISNNVDTTTHSVVPVTPDQRYTVVSDVLSIGVTRGTVTVAVIFRGAGLADKTEPFEQGSTEGQRVSVGGDVTPPPGYTTAELIVRHKDVESGIFYVTNVDLIKADNNRTSSTGPTFPVVGERTYQLVAAGRSELAVTAGYVYLNLTFSATGRSDLELPGPTIEITENVWTINPFDFTTPSGYNLAKVTAWGVDIDGGRFFFDDLTVIDQDATTSITDVVSEATYAGVETLEVTATAPLGAERVHLALVAQREGYGWTVWRASLSRAGEVLSTGEDVIRALLLAPDTGEEMSVLAGDIDAPDVIASDWEVKNLIARDAQREFATAVASPPLEWWTDTDCRQHWGVAADLFVDHAPGTEDEIVLLAGDLHVKDLEPLSEDATNRATRAKVIGAERPTATGQADLIESVATQITTQRDYRGRPVNRTLLIEDSTADHEGVADARSAGALSDNVRPARTIDVVLADTRTYPAMKSGDWVYPHKPTAGMTAPGLYPAETIEGTVYPARMRIIGRRRELGSGYRVVIRKGPGQEMELPAEMVRWGTNQTTLTLGDRRPSDITTDALGRPAGDAVLKLRAQAPR